MSILISGLRRVIVLTAIGLLAGAIDARAVTRTWKTTSGTGDWSVNTNWSGDTIPQTGEDVVINNAGISVLLTNSAPDSGSLVSLVISNTATLIFSNWNTTLSATDVKIQKSAIVTCAGPFTNAPGMTNRVYLACSNLTIDSGGSINVDGKGWLPKCGPGQGGGDRGGGGHGGAGAIGYSGRTALGTDYLGTWGRLGPFYGYGLTYGDPQAPISPGCGDDKTVKAGGGAVRIAATGRVIVNGTIRSRGLDAQGGVYGAGSGGSIYITCSTFDGAGYLDASGGLSAGDESGGGGGGRIAVVYDDLATQGTLSPAVEFFLGGRQSRSLSYSAGEHGTLFLSTTNFFPRAVMGGGGKLIIPGFTEWRTPSLLLTNSALEFCDGFKLTVDGDLVVSNRGELVLRDVEVTCGGNVWVDGTAPSSNSTLKFLDRVRFTCGGNFTLQNAACLWTSAGLTNTAFPERVFDLDVGNNFSLLSASRMWPESHPTNTGCGIMRIKAKYFTVAQDARIDGMGRGFQIAKAAGVRGYGPGGAYGMVGASHASQGGKGYSYNVTHFGPVYGSSNAPVTYGSAGGNVNNAGYRGGHGGSQLWVEARKIYVDGTVTMNGQRGNQEAGGGSGGSIYLYCRTFEGAASGSVTADGGVGSMGYSWGAGGGGRVRRLHRHLHGRAFRLCRHGVGHRRGGFCKWHDQPLRRVRFRRLGPHPGIGHCIRGALTVVRKENT